MISYPGRRGDHCHYRLSGQAGPGRSCDRRYRRGDVCRFGHSLALYQREKTDRGQLIDVSMLDSIVSWLGYFPHHYWHAGEEPARVGMRHHYVTPYGPYLAGDGICEPRRCQSFGLGDFLSQGDRGGRSYWKIRASPPSKVGGKTATNWKRRSRRFFWKRITTIGSHSQEGRVAHGEVRGIAQVLAHPQVAARRLIREADSPVGKVPVSPTRSRCPTARRATTKFPDSGKTVTRITDLGYDTGAIAQLRRDKII